MIRNDPERCQRSEIEITPAMIEAGVRAYASLAWHDSASEGTPREIAEAILRSGISAGRVLGPPPRG
jgi:hypothetical protein